MSATLNGSRFSEAVQTSKKSSELDTIHAAHLQLPIAICSCNRQERILFYSRMWSKCITKESPACQCRAVGVDGSSDAPTLKGEREPEALSRGVMHCPAVPATNQSSNAHSSAATAHQVTTALAQPASSQPLLHRSR